MFKNYVLVALRQFVRHRMFSALNVFCLAIGISFCLLIGEYVLHESGINANLRDVHRQYVLNSNWKVKNTGPEATTVGPLAKALTEKYPSLVAGYFRFNPVVNAVSAGDKHFREDVSICDTNLVSLYSLPLLYGNPQHAFTDVHSAVITEQFALKLFDRKDVLRRTLTFTNLSGKTTDYTISAVIRDMPYTTPTNAFSDHGYSVYLPFEGNQYYPTGTGEDDWNGITIAAFVKLQPGVRPEQLNAPIKYLLRLNAPETTYKNLQVELKPLSTYWLNMDNRAVARTLSMLTLVALGILLMAVVNFVNIMIGTSAYRIREIGLRKVFGGRRVELVIQYLVECTVLTFFAALLSLFFYTLFLPLANELLHTNLRPVSQFEFREWGYLVAGMLVVGMMAGFYPAWILSRSNAVTAVKGKQGSVEKGVWLRKSLLIGQFSLATGVIVFAIVLSRQVDYFFHSDLGYDKNRLLLVTAIPKQWDSVGVARMESIRTGLLGLSAVKDASISMDIPDRMPPAKLLVYPEGGSISQAISVQAITADERFASTYQIGLMEGRFFSGGAGGFVPGETVINESALKSLGWKDIAGKTLTIPNAGNLKVVGLIKDFHLSSLHESIEPLIVFHVRDNPIYRFMSVRLGAGSLSRSVEQVQAKWKAMSPSAPFDFRFMDDKLAEMYRTELQLRKASGIASGLMLLIVLLGIFGVLTLSLTKRIPEIAVRKVLGAGMRNILLLFIRQYAGLLGIANFIALPLAYVLTNRWLDQYPYRIAQTAGAYLLSGALVSVIAFALICLQCLKAASANPVKSLRTE
ncbi:MAG: ABC transporter permease [Bacteroidota bacterium]|nr:ABC transporter permease [Bacteroidota bacterium]MDP4216840.1 ABC transporter permease [Bacteroidota bacterium]